MLFKSKWNKIKLWWESFRQLRIMKESIEFHERRILALIDKQNKMASDYEKYIINYTESLKEMIKIDVAKELQIKSNYIQNIAEKKSNDVIEEILLEKVKNILDKELPILLSKAVSLDEHDFRRRIELSRMRRDLNYDHVMSNVRHVLNGVADNYLIKKYIRDDGLGGYADVNLSAENRIKDMSEIYDRLLSIINVDLIYDDLGMFYDPNKLRTKEYFIAQIIEPVYRSKINTLYYQYRRYRDEQVHVPVSVYDKSEDGNILERTELERKIDEALKSSR